MSLTTLDPVLYIYGRPRFGFASRNDIGGVIDRPELDSKEIKVLNNLFGRFNQGIWDLPQRATLLMKTPIKGNYWILVPVLHVWLSAHDFPSSYIHCYSKFCLEEETIHVVVVIYMQEEIAVRSYVTYASFWILKLFEDGPHPWWFSITYSNNTKDPVRKLEYNCEKMFKVKRYGLFVNTKGKTKLKPVMWTLESQFV